MTREESLKILRDIHDKALFSVRNALETLIPELNESDDERITRAINNMLPFIPDEAYANNGVTKGDVLNWLEKQKEQKPKNELENAFKYYTDRGISICCEDIKAESKKEQKPELPSKLDVAAEKQARSFGYMKEDYEYKELIETFKAGAEWMAKQGFISEGIINQTSGEDTMIDLNEYIGYLEDCEEVIVNIRKKEEKK